MIDLLLAAALAQAGAASTPLRCAAPDGPAECPHWRLVVRTGIGAGYLDPASIRREGALVELTTLLVGREPIEDGANRIVERVRFDCARRTAQSLHRTMFSPDGELIRDGSDPEAVPVAVVANSPFDLLLRDHCPGSRRGDDA